jgi:two-component system, sensor histidine kinase FlrB
MCCVSGLVRVVHEQNLPMGTALLSTTACAGTPHVDPALLEQAFSSFTEAAASLERSYVELQVEVTRLHRELQETNRDLLRSLEENRTVRQRLDCILAALPCGVIAIEETGQVSLANSEAARLLGFKPNAMLSGQLGKLFDSVHPQGSELEIGFAVNSRWMAVRRTHLDSSGTALFIVQDISGLKRLEDEHELLSRKQALAEMSATPAHESRNPLGSLELFAGLLARAELGEDEKAWVRQMQAGLRALAATVNNVLQFHSQPPPELAAVNLGELLDSVAQLLEPQAAAAKVELRVDHGLAGVQIGADRHRIAQVIMNLALNAFRFMPHGGTLEVLGQIAGQNDNSTALIEIADSGPGIATENLQRIFDAGFTTRPGSPGLGLAVCKTIIDQHGGSICAMASQSGATFHIQLPILRSGQ